MRMWFPTCITHFRRARLSSPVHFEYPLEIWRRFYQRRCQYYLKTKLFILWLSFCDESALFITFSNSVFVEWERNDVTLSSLSSHSYISKQNVYLVSSHMIKETKHVNAVDPGHKVSVRVCCLKHDSLSVWTSSKRTSDNLLQTQLDPLCIGFLWLSVLLKYHYRETWEWGGRGVGGAW